ncbi:11-oxo-beta-amyrin 30-oxidase-like isoform X2 [Olea europaea subsp. europaea]|uniref:11-oxo-beta-amyrin 30-oxidase-like isoform X2 n=1 Tax=Olea europaea subsp. europaea TaxID=158383 RepID=A0A8S0QWG4_OLEEU|nr:11-oxo-beta-amyrin 30-oxidase-like isoform X2 [Olea europaea subsp. europaea]
MGYSFERHINAFLWLSLISVTTFLLRELAKVFKLWIKARHIPGPPCTSFYGHCRLISESNFTDLLSESHKKYGPVVKLWLRPTQLLVSIKDKELIKEVLLNAEDKLPLTGRASYLGFGRSSLFISSFDKVEDQRKSLEVELNASLLERGSSVPAKVVKSVLERVQTLVVDGGLHCETISQHLSFTLMGATLFGDVFLTWSKASVYIELLMKIAKHACFWSSYGVTRYWKQEFWTYQQLCSELKGLTQELIRQCRQKYESDSLERDFDRYHMRHEPCAEMISMMFHGSLTMSTLIGNILTRLVTHPEIQHKIQSEIIMVRKISQRHDQQGVGGLPFLLATLYESARLLPAGLFLQRCSLKHALLFSPITSNNGLTNSDATPSLPPPPFKYSADSEPTISQYASLTWESESFSLIAKWDDKEDEDEAEDDLGGPDWLEGFEGFEDLWELIFNEIFGQESRNKFDGRFFCFSSMIVTAY